MHLLQGQKRDVPANDGLPDSYETANATAFGLNYSSAEAPPGLPTYTKTPIQ